MDAIFEAPAITEEDLTGVLLQLLDTGTVSGLVLEKKTWMFTDQSFHWFIDPFFLPMKRDTSDIT